MIIVRYLPYCLFALLCFVAFRLRWLTMGGAVAAFLMSVVFLLSGIHTFYLPLLLLVGGSLLSKLNRNDREKHGRNLRQVLANGSIGTLCLIPPLLVQTDYIISMSFLLAYAISFSVSICDTFSSEIGKFYKGKTIDILNFKRVRPGLSGGISLAGTLGGLGGAMCCALIIIFAFGQTFENAVSLAGFGFAGMLLDSVLGSLLQAKYEDQHGIITEDKTGGARLIKGFAWCNNDVVNVLSNMIMVMLFLFYLI